MTKTPAKIIRDAREEFENQLYLIMSDFYFKTGLHVVDLIFGISYDGTKSTISKVTVEDIRLERL